MKISKEFTVGLIAIITMVLLYWGFNFLSGKNLFDKSRSFYALYDDVDGLTTSRPIFINGLKVGQVESIYFHPEQTGRLVVKMSVSNDFNFPKTTTAKVVSDLLGDKTIDLILGDPGSPAAENGDTLQSMIELSLAEEVNRQVAPLKSKAEKLIGSIDTVLILVSGFLNEDTKNNFKETFNSLRRSFLILENTIKTVDHTVTDSQEDLETVIRSVASISENLERNNEKLNNIFTNISDVSDSLAMVNFSQTFNSLNKAMVSAEDIMRKINNGEGSAGKLINDPGLYENLEDASKQLDMLLLDIKYNPNRYVQFSVFGNKKTYSPAEIIEMEAEAKKKAAELEKKEEQEK